MKSDTKQSDRLLDARLNRRFCVAPMMARTDRHCRYLMRLLSRHVMLYTEMVVDKAILHGDRESFLAHDAAEQPVGFQIGGNQPEALAECAGVVERNGYNEINLNVGCPSSRVQSGRIGACLMREPERVAECVAAMRERVHIPVTVKCRTGVNHSGYDALAHFVDTVSRAGCETFIVHARTAVLTRATKHNLNVPPLKYDYVWRLKSDFPDLEIILNGGLQSPTRAKEAMRHLDGVMLGRAVYANMRMLCDVDTLFYDHSATAAPTAGYTSNEFAMTQVEILERYLAYISRELTKTALPQLVRPLGGLIHGLPSAASLRRSLFEIKQLSEIVDWVAQFGDKWVGATKIAFEASPSVEEYA